MCIVCGPGGNRFIQSIAGRYAPAGARARTRFVAEEIAPAIPPPLDPSDLEDLKGSADVILRGGPILTLRGAGDVVAQAVAVRAGRIQAVGDAEQVLAFRGRLTRTIELDGRALLPGFVIADWHPPLSLLCDWLESDETPAAAIAAAMAERSGEWLALRVGESSDDRSNATVVEAASRPAVIVDRMGSVVAASAAAATLAPELGEALPQTRPNVSALLPTLLGRLTVSREPLRARLGALLGEAARGGVTTLRFCGLGALTGNDDADLARSAAGDSPPLRLRGAVDADLALQPVGDNVAPGGDDMFRVDTATHWIDERTTEARALAESLVALRKRGWRVTLHANTPDAAALAMDAFSTAARSATLLDASDGVERRGPLSPESWARLRRLGLSTGLILDEGGASGAAAADLAEAGGVSVSVSLDRMAGLSPPLRMLPEAARDGEAQVENWLSSVTRGSAIRCGAGAILGSLEVGKYADFAFLSGDPRRAASLGGRVQCVGTWIAGREIHS